MSNRVEIEPLRNQNSKVAEEVGGVLNRTKLNTNYKNEDHFKHLKKIRTNNNKYNKNED